jgi:hypothetical protein
LAGASVEALDFVDFLVGDASSSTVSSSTSNRATVVAGAVALFLVVIGPLLDLVTRMPTDDAIGSEERRHRDAVRCVSRFETSRFVNLVGKPKPARTAIDP